MCIIAAIPEGKNVSKETLQRCWNNNPHGGGFMFTDGKQIIIKKSLKSFKNLYSMYYEARKEYPTSAFVVHFRISTHGVINENNCHPFHVSDELGFAHNGIISSAPFSAKYSDTYMFNEHILKQMPHGFIDTTHYHDLIKAYIGYGSKLAFLGTDNVIRLVNEQAGEWNDGIWWSNSGYKSEKYYDYGGTKKEYTPTVNKYQGSLAFASAVLPKVDKGSQGYNNSKNKYVKASQDVYSKIVTSKNYDAEFADSFSKRYDSNCVVCDSVLTTYSERANMYCRKCFDRHDDFVL